MVFRFRFLLALVFLFTLPSGELIAQITLTDSVATKRPEVIPVVSVNQRIELDLMKIKNIDKRTEISSEINKLDTIVPNKEEEIETQIKAYQNFKKSHPNKQKVVNLVNKWGSYNAYLESLQFSINEHTEKNATWLKELEFKEKSWELTYLNAVEQEVPAEVLFQIKDTQKEVERLHAKISKQNNELLKIDIEILILKERINAVIEDLNRWKQSEEFSILTRRHFPIWHAHKEPLKPKEQAFDAWVSFKGNIIGVIDYVQSPENNILTFLILLFLLAFWFWRIKKVSAGSVSPDLDMNQKPPKKIITQRPVSAFVFTSTILSSLYFANTPNLFGETLLLVALISSVPLVRPTVHAKFKDLMFFVILLYIMNTIKSYVWYSSIVYRVYLFVELAIILVIILRFTFPIRQTARLKVQPFSLTLIKGVPFYYLVLLVGLITLIFGYTNFTDFSLKVLIHGGTLVIVMLGLLTVLEGLTIGTLQIYYSKNKVGMYQNKYVVERKMINTVNTFAYIFSLVYFLSIVDLYDPIVEWLKIELTEPIDAGLITFTWGSILTFFGVLIGSYIITSIIAKFIEGGALDFMRLPKGIPAIISVVVRYFIIGFAIVLALSYLGVDLGSFNIMAGALGLGIGFGLQNIISNFISGLILIFERPIQPDDVVEVGSLLGNVRKIGVRSSNIRTFNGAEVVVPNSNLISNEVINWTLSDSIKRMEINVGTAYGSSLRQVVEILKQAALDYEHTMKDPEPQALFKEFGDSSLNFRLLYWVPVEYGILSKSEISIDIYEKLAEADITIPFPQRDLNFKPEDLKALKGDTQSKPSIENLSSNESENNE